jgi:hypothetical protein
MCNSDIYEDRRSGIGTVGKERRRRRRRRRK